MVSATSSSKAGIFLFRVVSAMTFWGEGGCVVASPGLPGRYPCGGAVEFSWSRRAPEHVVASPGPSLPVAGRGAYLPAFNSQTVNGQSKILRLFLIEG